MKIEELLAKLQENADALEKPVQVEIPGVGVIFVRRRTVLEFEQMATVKTENIDSPTGYFAPSIARLLCDEEGRRFPADVQAQLVELLSRQPESVFHLIVDAADGKGTEGAISPN